VLERDLFAIAAAEIGEVRVLRTLVGGKTVFAAGGAGAASYPPAERSQSARLNR
jgi:hypothetical protein